jgi:hypothetical protein
MVNMVYENIFAWASTLNWKYTKFEDNKVWNVSIIQRAITKPSVGQHGPPTNAEAGSGAMDKNIVQIRSCKAKHKMNGSFRFFISIYRTLGVNQYIDISIRIDIYLPGNTRYRSKSIFRYEVRFNMWVLKYWLVFTNYCKVAKRVYFSL